MAWLAERLDQRFQDMDGFLRRVELVAGVGPVHHVGQGGCGECRVPLDEQVGGFMAVLHKG